MAGGYHPSRKLDAVISDNRYGLYHPERILRFSNASTGHSNGHWDFFRSFHYEMELQTDPEIFCLLGSRLAR